MDSHSMENFCGSQQSIESEINENKVFNLQNYHSQLNTPASMSSSTQKHSSLISPVGVTKISLPQKPPTSSLLNQTNIAQSLSFLNQNTGSTPNHNNILIKTTKTNSNGQPTYVAISFPQNVQPTQNTSNSGGERSQAIPLTIQPIKMKLESHGSALMNVHTKSDVEAKSNNIILQKLNQGYNESNSYTQSNPITMGSGYPYGSGHDGSMYSQASNMATYLDATHGAPHNQMYQGYPSQANQQGSLGVGVSAQALGVAHQAQYLQPGQAANQRVPISHTTRASPMTVQWLIDNYETADGVSLPRSTLYNHYLRHCSQHKIDAVNAASFGKLIRSVFLGLKTRRLGTRGNSKYHYYGIRVKTNSPLARLIDDTQVALRAQPVASKRPLNGGSYESTGTKVESSSDNGDPISVASHQQYLGDTSEGLPEVPAIDLTESLPDEISKSDISAFGNYYRSHCEALFEVVASLQFELVEALWQAFYRSPAAENKSNGIIVNGLLETHDYNITKKSLIILCKYRPTQEFMKETDYVLYQKLVFVLIPDVLRAVPSSLTQAIRNFAKSLENMLIGSMSEMPKEIVNIKVAAVSAFSQTLRRYTSLNHLAQAARAVLQNPQQINQMWSDLNKVDFNNVQEQSSWVCQCNETLIQKLEEDFKFTLSQQQSLEEWALWLEKVVGLVLEQHQGRESYPKAARQFLLNWSFYSSMIIRDLTLRSAASFGSFHLIRLLYDEYMFYLVENKVAEHTGKSPLSVMAECVGNSLTHSFNDTAVEDDDEGESSNDESNLSPSAPVLNISGNEPMESKTASNRAALESIISQNVSNRSSGIEPIMSQNTSNTGGMESMVTHPTVSKSGIESMMSQAVALLQSNNDEPPIKRSK